MGDGRNAAGSWGGAGMKGRVQTGRGTEEGGEGDGTSLPVDGGVVTGQPREAQDEGKVSQCHQLEGDVLLMLAMDAYAGGIVVGDGSRRAAVDELDWDGVRVGERLQEVDTKKGRVQKGAGGAGVDESQHRAGELTGDEDMNGERKMAGGGEGEGMGKRKHAAQPGPYWLGREFPGWVVTGGVVGGCEGGGRVWGGI